MKCKKLISAALAGVMALSLAAPAFATNTVITATYAEPKIEVSVPTTATAVINPYALPTKYYYDSTTGKTCKADAENAVAFSTPASSVAAQPMFLVNYGETALKVSATATAAVKTGSDMKIAAELPEEGGTTAPVKTMTVSVAAAPVTGLAAQWKTLDGATKPAMAMETATATVWNALDWTADNTDLKKAVALDKGAEETELGTLAAIAEPDGGGDAAVVDGGILAISLLGSATKKPKTAWTAKDIVTVTVAYSFEVSAE